MKSILPLFIMIDACGWEVIKQEPFGAAFAPERKRLQSVFGYSSTCIPTILSGRWPTEHRNWCYFVYDPERSPFRFLRPLRWLPKALTSRRIFRHWLSKRVKVRLNFRGYFDLYNIPFEHISLFDFSEKKSPLQPKGMNCGSNIFDFLETKEIPYYVSHPAKSEAENKAELFLQIRKERIDFAFLYWPDLDGLLHREGNDSPLIGPKLRQYEGWIAELLGSAENHYHQVHLYIFSDHGMANCVETLDLRKRIDALDLQVGRDYAAVYDSTMARFWFLKSRAREAIVACLNTIPQGRILPDEELAALHTLFEDRHFGELIFLVREGVLIVPSHMGERPIRGMHGYHPSEKHSYAALFTNQPAACEQVKALPDLFHLMVAEAEQALKMNRSQSELFPSIARNHPTPA
ncbi:MAG: alkaline phosphatase family protein [Verrucomicrobiota bacterium]